jgi:hypothetical protein
VAHVGGTVYWWYSNGSFSNVPDGAVLDFGDFEETSWMREEGPEVEGRVAASLLDMVDLNNDGQDQNSDLPLTFSQIWASGLNAQTDETFEEF